MRQGLANLFPLVLLTVFFGCQDRSITELPSSDFQSTITGRVLDENQPVAAARVRIKGDTSFVETNNDGRFELRTQKRTGVRLTASKEGYFIGGQTVDNLPAVIHFEKLPSDDNPDYKWVDPTPDENAEHNCGNCHQEIYDEWQASGHAHSATNRRLLNLYDGSNWQGEPNHGWSLLADHPDGASVCWTCHVPDLRFDDPAVDDLRLVRGTSRHGVHCDLCHKIQDVSLDQVGLTHGRFGFKLLRPPEGQLFFGPLDDVDRGEDTFSPLQKQSQYCAACHEGVLFGVHVYKTYSEWLASPARQQGRSCQSCHMRPTGTMTNIAPNSDGIERDPATLASHRFFPNGHNEMLKSCLDVDVLLLRSTDEVQCQVIVTSHDVGHRVPTGFVDRHLFLVVEPVDKNGELLSAHNHAMNPVLPPAAGRQFAGQPGRMFARVLRDEQGRYPVPFWRASAEFADTRLKPNSQVKSEFVFPIETESVRVRLLYRRFWEEISTAKKWPDETITVFDETASIAEAVK